MKCSLQSSCDPLLNIFEISSPNFTLIIIRRKSIKRACKSPLQKYIYPRRIIRCSTLWERKKNVLYIIFTYASGTELSLSKHCQRLHSESPSTYLSLSHQLTCKKKERAHVSIINVTRNQYTYKYRVNQTKKKKCKTRKREKWEKPIAQQYIYAQNYHGQFSRLIIQECAHCITHITRAWWWWARQRYARASFSNSTHERAPGWLSVVASDKGAVLASRNNAYIYTRQPLYIYTCSITDTDGRRQRGNNIMQQLIDLKRPRESFARPAAVFVMQIML